MTAGARTIALPAFCAETFCDTRIDGAVRVSNARGVYLAIATCPGCVEARALRRVAEILSNMPAAERACVSCHRPAHDCGSEPCPSGVFGAPCSFPGERRPA